MAGTKKFNSDVEIQGKQIIYTVPNGTGTVITYNPSTKEVSTRTNEEIISDLSLVTNTINVYSPDLGLPDNSFKPKKSGFYRPNGENDYGSLLMWVSHPNYINEYGAGIAFDYGGNNAWLTGTDSAGNKTPNKKIWTSGDFNPSDFATSAQLGNKVDKAGDTMTGNLNALTISAQNASDKLIYDNIENYGSPLQINANASLGIFLQANANNILYVGASYVETYKDLYVSAGSIIYTTNHGNSSLWYQAYNWGNHANAGYATQTWVNNNTIQTPNGRPINISGEDLNTWRKTGFYVGEGLQNAPNNGWFYILVQTYDNNVWIKQTATSFGSGNAPNITYERVMLAGTWTDWAQVYKTSDFNIQNYYTKNESLNLFVGKNGVETIYDTKTFNSSPVIPNGTLGSHAVNLNQLTGQGFLTLTEADGRYVALGDILTRGVGYGTNNTDAPYIYSTTGNTKYLATQNWVNNQGFLTLANIPTYSAGNGLTLSGNTFSLPVTINGAGVVIDVAQNTNGITVTKGNIAWSNIVSTPTTLAGYGITDGMNTSHPANSINQDDIDRWNINIPTVRNISGTVHNLTTVDVPAQFELFHTSNSGINLPPPTASNRGMRVYLRPLNDTITTQIYLNNVLIDSYVANYKTEFLSTGSNWIITNQNNMNRILV